MRRYLMCGGQKGTCGQAKGGAGELVGGAGGGGEGAPAEVGRLAGGERADREV